MYYTKNIRMWCHKVCPRGELQGCFVVHQSHRFSQRTDEVSCQTNVIRRSAVCARVMLFVQTCSVPLHESYTRIVTSTWCHSFAWVWHWRFIPLTFIKHQQPGIKRAKLLLRRRGQPAYVNPYFLLTARLLRGLIGRNVTIWGHVSYFITLNW